MIKNIIFDIGMVLVDFNWNDYMHTLYSDEEVIEDLTKAVWGSKWWKELDLGIMPEEEVIKLFHEGAPHRHNEVKESLDKFGSALIKTKHAVPWVEELKNAGYNVYYLSNWSDFLIKANAKPLDFIEHMDGGVFSFEEGLIKPDKAIYQRICEKYDLDRSECLFIDDNVDNINSAKEFGMHGIVFKTYNETYPVVCDYLKQNG